MLSLPNGTHGDANKKDNGYVIRFWIWDARARRLVQDGANGNNPSTLIGPIEDMERMTRMWRFDTRMGRQGPKK